MFFPGVPAPDSTRGAGGFRGTARTGATDPPRGVRRRTGAGWGSGRAGGATSTAAVAGRSGVPRRCTTGTGGTTGRARPPPGQMSTIGEVE